MPTSMWTASVKRCSSGRWSWRRKPRSSFLPQISRRIFDHLQRQCFLVYRIGFVPRTEVEDLAFADGPQAAAMEMVAFVPDQHVAMVQHIIRKPLLWIV